MFYLFHSMVPFSYKFRLLSMFLRLFKGEPGGLFVFGRFSLWHQVDSGPAVCSSGFQAPPVAIHPSGRWEETKEAV